MQDINSQKITTISHWGEKEMRMSILQSRDKKKYWKNSCTWARVVLRLSLRKPGKNSKRNFEVIKIRKSLKSDRNLAMSPSVAISFLDTLKTNYSIDSPRPKKPSQLFHLSRETRETSPLWISSWPARCSQKRHKDKEAKLNLRSQSCVSSTLSSSRKFQKWLATETSTPSMWWLVKTCWVVILLAEP